MHLLNLCRLFFCALAHSTDVKSQGIDERLEGHWQRKTARPIF